MTHIDPKRKIKRTRLLVSIIVAAVLIAAAFLCVLKLRKPLPKWVIWNEKTVDCQAVKMPLLEEKTYADPTKGSSIPDKIILEKKKISVLKNGEIIWESDKGVKVSDFLWEDIDRDNEPELLLLCWKVGRFGEHKPFWVKEDEKEWSEHIFIYDWEEERIKPKWMASDIGMDADSWSYDDTNKLMIHDIYGAVTRWDYGSFGLTFIEECEEAKDISFLVTGDNLIHFSIISDADLNHNESFDYLYAGVKEEVENADISVLCQETIFIDNPWEYSDFPRFGTPVRVGEAALRAGFDMVAAANNHALDKEMRGIDVTTDFYKENGVKCLGIQGSSDAEYEPFYVLKKDGIRIAFLNYTFHTNGLPLPKEQPFAVHTLDDKEQVVCDIKDAKKQADLIVVIVHWGEEYAAEIDDFQREWTDVFAKENVDMVIGNHPHVLQDRGKILRGDGRYMYIYYSLGNFVSAQMEEECKIGGLAEFSVRYCGGKAAIAQPRLQMVSNFMKAELLDTFST